MRERFVDLTHRASGLLLGERTAYALVAAPTAAARDDVLYLAKRLTKLGRVPRALVLNRADTAAAPYVTVLRRAEAVPGSVVDALTVLEDESARTGSIRPGSPMCCSPIAPGDVLGLVSALTLERPLTDRSSVPMLRGFSEENHGRQDGIGDGRDG